MTLEPIGDLEIYLLMFATMTENDVRRWVHARLPTRGERVVFDDLSRGCSKGTVDLVAARAIVRAKINGSVLHEVARGFPVLTLHPRANEDAGRGSEGRNGQVVLSDVPAEGALPMFHLRAWALHDAVLRLARESGLEAFRVECKVGPDGETVISLVLAGEKEDGPRLEHPGARR